jgi:anti-sigma-K factor RskA
LDIGDYISSGVLELYATGALTAAEKAEVELQARQNPEIQKELNIILDTLDKYAQLHAVTPPAHLRNKVLTAVAQTSFNSEENILPPNGSFNKTENTEVISINRNDKKTKTSEFNWLVAAAIALLVLSNALSIYFYRNWKASEQNLELALASQQQYAQNLQQVNQQLDQNRRTLALLTDNTTLRVVLNGVAKTPEAEVVVYWNQPKQIVLINAAKLPTPPAGKQYQLWAIANGKPIDAGLVGAQGLKESLHQMKKVTTAQAFAITLEPQGGSVNPTLEAMVVMGQI